MNMGAVVLVLLLASTGIAVSFYGAAEGIQEWWNSDELQEFLDKLRNKLRL